ncbi:MAG TPA: NUDIX hydrolase [Gammaproteobacteria bacterium]|nr:NUDIX hydrolase [Gammaproteobacteria bacterium]
MTRPKPWREIRREHLLDCRIFEIERSVAKSPVDGSEHDYFRVLSPDWVQIIPVTAAGEIVMVRQFRHGSSSVVLEIPGGLVDPGEEPAAAAARECLEETGYRADSVQPMAALNPNPAIHAHRLHAFLARDVTKVGEIQNTATEHTEVELVRLADLPGRLRAGDIDHALIACTLWQYLYDYA